MCREHLLGEHRELHAIWVILTAELKGYSRHPETLRWKDKLNALHKRHEKLVIEMNKRGFKHQSPLDPKQATGSSKQDTFVNPISEQIAFLRAKGCDCDV